MKRAALSDCVRSLGRSDRIRRNSRLERRRPFNEAETASGDRRIALYVAISSALMSARMAFCGLSEKKRQAEPAKGSMYRVAWAGIYCLIAGSNWRLLPAQRSNGPVGITNSVFDATCRECTTSLDSDCSSQIGQRCAQMRTVTTGIFPAEWSVAYGNSTFRNLRW